TRPARSWRSFASRSSFSTPSEQSYLSASDVFSLCFEVDDDVGDRDCEAFTGSFYHAALEPVRSAGWMRGDDDLVGSERSQGVLHRLYRVAVADLASRFNARSRELHEAGV